MMFVKLLLVVMIFCSDKFAPAYGTSIVKQLDDGVELTGIGKVDLTVPDVLNFTMPKLCQGKLQLCYVAENVPSSDNSKSFENVDAKCPRDSCLISLNLNPTAFSTMLNTEYHKDSVIAVFIKDSLQFCPFKTTVDFQTFTILEMPQCVVIITGASLPEPEVEKEDDEKDKVEDVSDAPAEEKGINKVFLGCGAAITLVILVSFFAFMGYCANRCEKKKHAQKPKPSLKSAKTSAAATSPAIVATSPTVQPTSPVTLPTVSPSTPKTPAKSPAETPKQEAEDKPKTVSVQKPTPPPVTPSKAVKTPEAEPYDVNRAIENAAKSLQSNGLLKFGGSAVLKEIQRHYNTKPHRQSTIDELDFFLLIVSQAYIEVHGFLKRARQLLCQNGAVFERGQWRSFNETTRRYIAKASTPGYVCWYAFACEYGDEIKISDEVKAETIFEKLSVPALLTVFFREDLKDQIRRSVYAHMRRHFKKIHDSFPEMKLYALPYPLCLLADMKKKDEKAFNESANDKTYSTPLEQINQRFKDDTTVEEHLTDETQVSHTDGKERLKTVSTEVLGSQTSATTTVKMEWQKRGQKKGNQDAKETVFLLIKINFLY